MSVQITQKPTLVAHFEPRLLSELGVAIHKLTFWVRYEPTYLQKTGLDALLAKTPFGDDEPVAMDVDISCGLYDEMGRLIEHIWYGNVRDETDLVRHHGDTFIGMNKAYRPNVIEESLSVRLASLPDEVHQVTFFVHSHHRQDLNLAILGECVLSDGDGAIVHNLPFSSLDEGVYGVCAWQLVKTKDEDWQMTCTRSTMNTKDIGSIASKFQDLKLNIE